MRIRTRSQNITVSGFVERSRQVDYLNNDSFTDYVSDESFDFGDLICPATTSTIQDIDERHLPEARVDPKTLKWVRIHSEGPRRLGPRHNRVSKPCIHTKWEVKPSGDISYQYGNTFFAGNPTFERTETITERLGSGILGLKRWGAGLSLEQLLFETSPSNTAGPFYGHDWFAIMSQFDEACTQFLPSSFLAGEDLAQSSIFIDALKLVFNPSHAIRTLIKLGKRIRGYSKLSLGNVATRVSKDAANTNLFYQFGVKPAIDDVRNALDAHRKVSERMRFLRRVGGKYIPVRVRKELPSTVGFYDLGPRDPSDYARVELAYTERKSVAVLGCWARVREDLTFGDTWSAYLQHFGVNKIVGLAWELIPFSFVVDWFTNAQERINYYTRLRTGGPFAEFKNLWASEKKVTESKFYLVPGRIPSESMGFRVPTHPLELCTIRTSEYNRGIRIPDTSGVVDISHLGLFHLQTAGSLIIQRL